MRFDPALSIQLHPASMTFEYAPGVFGPPSEMRHLDAIRPSLRDPHCSGPDPVYSIAMDVGREEDKADLERRFLLFGVVAYARALGNEPVRSQGTSCHCSALRMVHAGIVRDMGRLRHYLCAGK